MYFPYLRGKQFELLALRELIEYDLISDKIVPILEPLKPTSTLLKTIETFIDNDKELGFIINPKVGSFKEEYEELNDVNKVKLDNLISNNNVIKAHLVCDDNIKDINISENISSKVINIMAIFNSNERKYLDSYVKQIGNKHAKYSLIPDESVYRRNIVNSKVLFDDKFEPQDRNSDYCDIEEFFSDDHKFFLNDNYIGFSDYSIVGSGFKESGFAPYAIAIHIVFFDNDMNLRIKHFVSNSNDDIKDPAGKFSEALKKLVEWVDEKEIDTYGIRKFKEYYENEKYPGLGTVKKLSVMHHLELMSQFLNYDEVE